MAQLLDAPANPARPLAAALRQSLGLAATPTLLPNPTVGAWTVLFGSERDAAAALAHSDPRCFGCPVRIVQTGRADRPDDKSDRVDAADVDPDDGSGGYVVRFSDFVHEMEADERVAADQHYSSGGTIEEIGDAKRRTSSSDVEPMQKRSRSSTEQRKA
jgi:hypothetical protein